MSEIRIVVTEEGGHRNFKIIFDDEKVGPNDNRYNAFVNSYFDYQAKADQYQTEEKKFSFDLKNRILDLLKLGIIFGAVYLTFSLIFENIIEIQGTSKQAVVSESGKTK